MRFGRWEDEAMREANGAQSTATCELASGIMSNEMCDVSMRVGNSILGIFSDVGSNLSECRNIIDQECGNVGSGTYLLTAHYVDW